MTGIQATENESIFYSDIKYKDEASTRGATDIYYEVIDYKISNEHNRKYLGKITVTDTYGASFTWRNMEITYQRSVSGQYEKYSYTADFTIYARKVDAMGHYLGSETFVNKDVKLYDYVAI